MTIEKLIRWHRNRAEMCRLQEQRHRMAQPYDDYHRNEAHRARGRAAFHLECVELLEGVPNAVHA